MKHFALIGAAGYVAPRHMEAIKACGHTLVAALDPSDSVGIIDRYFPEAAFFTEFERFDRHLEKLKRKGEPVDYVSICSPNYLHDAHIRFGLRIGADVICEKPMVLNPWNVEALAELEKDYPGKINNILQLRLHDSIIALKEKVQAQPNKRFIVDLNYIASRGNWYHVSWKGDESKSGGITTNIGVHFFDMLLWVFGECEKIEVSENNAHTAQGKLILKQADVSWMLSIDQKRLPQEAVDDGLRTYRRLKIEDESFDFSKGFENLHQKSYEHILSGNGFSVAEVVDAIRILHDIRKIKT